MQDLTPYFPLLETQTRQERRLGALPGGEAGPVGRHLPLGDLQTEPSELEQVLTWHETPLCDDFHSREHHATSP